MDWDYPVTTALLYSVAFTVDLCADCCDKRYIQRKLQYSYCKVKLYMYIAIL